MQIYNLEFSEAEVREAVAAGGEVVSEVIIQAAATSFIHMQMLAMSQVLHNMRKTGSDKGASADGGAARTGGCSGGSSGGMGHYC